ncbi:MAG TPA: hypothetical protein VMZ50_02240, partial [Phycisphaerae bacterium]|nr:hypothetical protein [Phycisphaerae bacterium]
MTMPSVHQLEPIEAAPSRTSTWPVVLGVLSIIGGYHALTSLRGMVFSGPVTLAKEMMAGDFSFLGRMGLLGWASAAASLCAGA